MPSIKQYQIPDIMLELRNKYDFTYAVFEQRTGLDFNNLRNGHLPQNHEAAWISVCAAFPQEEGLLGRLQNAYQHDFGLHKYQEKRHDPAGVNEFCKLYKNASDAWCNIEPKQPLVELATNTGVKRKAVLGWRNNNIPRDFSLLDKAVNGLGHGLYDLEMRPLIEAYFKARRLGKYETTDELVGDIGNITHWGELLSRLRLASFYETEEIAKILKIDFMTWQNYEKGKASYEAHWPTIAETLVQKELRKQCDEKVRVLHGTLTLEEIFARLETYDDTHDLLQAIAQNKGITLVQLATLATVRIPEKGVGPEPETAKKFADALDLGEYRRNFLDFVARRLEQNKRRRVPDEGRLEEIFDGPSLSSMFPTFGAFAAAVRLAKGMSQQDVADAWGCHKQNVSSLETEDKTRGERMIHAWAKAVGLEEPRIERVVKFAEELRRQDIRGDFGQLLKAWLTANPQVKKLDIALKAKVSLSTIDNIINGASACPLKITIEKITGAIAAVTQKPELAEPRAFAKAAGPLVDASPAAGRAKR